VHLFLKSGVVMNREIDRKSLLIDVIPVAPVNFCWTGPKYKIVLVLE
jgi:hypothetical protein